MSQTAASIETLRDVLLDEERRRIGAVEHRLDDPEVRGIELAEVMSEALNLASKDPKFARVLAPTIEKALFESVRANPEGLADALFPVLVPTIRRVVLSLLERTFENFNRVLDISVSPRSFVWRLESWRTGRPFAEIVLYHTVKYRVEQVLLIHRETGLLLAQVGLNNSEADLVSAMLTAIQDFARDSFQMGDATIRTFKIGDLTVLIETSPYATTAAAVRGSAPIELSDHLAVALETVQLRFANDLSDFVGDTSLFEATKPILETCLTTVYLEQPAPKRKPKPNPLVLPLLGLVGLVGLVWWAWSAYQTNRWHEALQAMRLEPGFLIIEDNPQRLVGLRDPLARDPQMVLETLGYANVPQVWGQYQSLEPQLILERARVALEPDKSTAVELRGSSIVLSGQATAAWVKRAKLIARGLSGITAVDSRAIDFVKVERR